MVIIKVGAIITLQLFLVVSTFLIYCNIGKSDMLMKAKGVIMGRGKLDSGLFVFSEETRNHFLYIYENKHTCTIY